MLKKLLSLLILLSVFQGFAQLPLSGTYTIGGASPSYPTIQAAVTDLVTKGVSGPTTFKIRTGTYNERVSVGVVLGTSNLNRVTFTSESNKPEDVIIKATSGGTTNNHHIFQLINTSFITIKNLTVENLSSQNASGIHVSASGSSGTSESNIVENCIVKMPLAGNDFVIGISVSSATLNSITIGASFNNNVVKNNKVYGGSLGIYLHGGLFTPASGNKIDDNQVYDAYKNGIQCNYSLAGTINGNRVQMQHSDLVRPAMNGMHIERGQNTVVANNFISGGFNNSTGGAGLYIYWAEENMKFYHNTVIYDNSNVKGSAVYVKPYHNIEIKNNIFINEGLGYSYYFDYTLAYAANIFSDYNLLYTNGTYLARWETDVADFEGYKTQSGKEANSVNFLPVFIGENDFHTYDPALNNLGTPTTDVTKDKDGDARSATTPDMGADEFTPLAIDLAIQSVGVLGNAKQGDNTVEVMLANGGTNSLNGSSVSLSYSTDSGATWSTPENFTATQLNASNTTESFTFSTQWNIPKANIKYLMARINSPGLTGDGRADNDIKGQSVCVGLAGTYTIGASGDFRTIQSALDLISCTQIDTLVTFNLLPGTFNEKLVITPIAGASAINRIVFQSSTGNPEDVVIQAESGGTHSFHHVIQLKGADYVTLKNITVKNTSTSEFSSVIHLTSQADNNIISGCVIELMPVLDESYYRIGIVAASPTNMFGIGKNADSNLIENNHFINGSYGIRLNGDAPWFCYKNKIIGNTMENINLIGIRLYFQNSATVDNNIVNMNPASKINFNGIYLSYCNEDFSVSNNYVRNAGVEGLKIYDCDGTTAALIANNMIAGGYADTTAFKSGLSIYNSTKIRVYFNTMLMDRGNSAAFSYYGTAGSEMDLRNNIFHNSSSGYAFYTNYPSAISNSDYNNFYNASPGKLSYWTGENAGLEQHRTASGMDANSMNVDPFFYSSSDLHISNAFLDGRGEYLAAVPLDYDGEERNSANPDIGADEFVPGGGSPPIAQFLATVNFFDVDFLDQSLNDVTSWFWDFDVLNNQGLYTSTEANPHFAYDREDSFKVCLTVFNSISNHKTCKIVYTSEPPAAETDFTYLNKGSLTVQFTDASKNNPTEWTWDFGDGVGASDKRNPEYIFPSSGNFYVVLFSANSSGGGVMTKKVTVSPTGLVEVDNLDFSVYPNPAKDILFLHFNAAEEIKSVELLSVLGQKWREFGDKASENTLEMDLSDIPEGMYVVQIRTHNNKVYSKHISIVK